MSKRTDIKSILVIGSGPIVIGQGCEFDYSGTQAIKALKELGYKVLLINPNPATMMTTPYLADKVYMEPLECEYVEQIFQRDRPDAILSTMGGQTGLNLTLNLHKKGLLKKYNVEVLGASIDSIEKAEDRGKFKDIVSHLGLDSAKSEVIYNEEQALKVTENIPFPLIIRPSYTLGGRGGSIAYNKEEYIPLIRRAIEESPVNEVLVEESLIGWKEFEMEVMRDKKDNAIIVCSIENIDPMGVHTGDSITIAPIQTLTDKEYQKMRDASINILREVGVDCGGSNVQFAVDPKTGRMIVIEMNPRVSRSSALASKATGFPIAHCSAKLAVGFTLDEVVNEITGQSVSCFEPALDYCAVKVPRFELEKFPLPASALGSQMRSVGESLAIGRTALEALNKAIRSTEIKREGLETLDKDVETLLNCAHPNRIFACYTTIFNEGYEAIEKVNKITGFDPWFLYQLYKQTEMDKKLLATKENLEISLLKQAKEYGMSDRRISKLTGIKEDNIEALRKENNIIATTHFVDTCAGEAEAITPYCYNTFGETDEGEPLKDQAVIILASGPNRIGQGLEFDTCCTLSSLAYQKRGKKTILINCNPETVSTDYNVSDRLYMEPLTKESVKSIMEKEQVKDIVVQLGGQTPLNLAKELEESGANIIGTSLQGIDDTEDREEFAKLLKRLNLRQAKNAMAATVEEVHKAAHEIGFPVLLRPSFVLGGRAMFISYDDKGLDDFFESGDIVFNEDSPILVDQFIEDAFEYDLDAVCDGQDIYIGGILQHIEAAGIHSGDSAAVFPPYKSTPQIIEQMKTAALEISRSLNIQGFMNIQFAVKDEVLYIIEVNPRASRTVPFISKNSGINLIEVAVGIWEGENLKQQGLVKKGESIGEGKPITGWSIKEAVFSFDRFNNIDPMLGPEMKSTGETIGIGATFGEAYAKSQTSSGNILPTQGRVLISVNKRDRKTIIPIAKEFKALGFEIAATAGTAQTLFENGILPWVVGKSHEREPNIVDYLRSKKFDLVVNTPMGFQAKRGDDALRTETMRLKIPYTTTLSAAKAAIEGIKYLKEKEYLVRELPQFKN